VLSKSLHNPSLPHPPYGHLLQLEKEKGKLSSERGTGSTTDKNSEVLHYTKTKIPDL